MPGIADKFGRASLPTETSVATTVKTTRAPGVLVLEAFDLSKYSVDTPVFFVTYKKTTDPVTGLVSITNLVSWKALVNPGANTLTNLTVQPGYVDGGNAVGDFIECIPTSAWGNSLIDGIFVGHNPDGTFKKSQLKTDLGGDAVDPVFRDAELVFDHVASGVVLAGLGYGTNLNVSMTAGVAYINGNRQIIPAVATRAYTPNKDTYVDALYNVSGTATLVYTEVANNAASPALAADSIRLGIVVSGATSIANVGSLNQGQEHMALPIASQIPYAVADSLGNLICPRDPRRQILCHRMQTVQSVIGGGTPQEIVQLQQTVKVPTGRKIKLSVAGEDLYTNTNNASGVLTAWEGAVNSGRQLLAYRGFQNGGSGTVGIGVSRTFTPLTQNPTIRIAIVSAAGGTVTVDATAGAPFTAWIELV